MLKTSSFSVSLLGLLGFFIGVFIFLPSANSARDFETKTALQHQVSPGESLSKIAQRYFPLTAAQTLKELILKIRERNGLRGTMIHPDQQLLIPVVRSRPVVARTIPKEKDFEAKGIYVNRFTMASPKMTRLMNRLISVQGNTMILDGKDMSGRLSFPSGVDLAGVIGAAAGPMVRDPAKLFHALHRRGIHICIRLVVFHDPLLAKKKPDLAIQSLKTGGPWEEDGEPKWVNPFHPAVQRYNLDIARELASMGVDEIQFDYIRFPTRGNIGDADYGFDRCMTPKHRVITEFLATAHRELAPSGVLVSIDVFGVMGWERPEDIRMTGQKIDDLVQHCDVISPMIYPSHFYGPFENMDNPGDQPFHCVSETCRKFATILRNSEVTLRPWIQAFPFGTSRFDEAYVLEELRALSESETSGWLLWSAGNAYDVSWKALNRWNDLTSHRRLGMRLDTTGPEEGPISPAGCAGPDVQLENLSSFIGHEDSISVKAQGLGLPDVKWED
jgi:hypothetical protein